jgi:hypothetical protein
LTALSACGDDGAKRDELLSPSTASQLRSTLASVEQRVDDGDCAGAEEQSQALSTQVGSLPRRVDADLRTALADGASRLRALVVDRCQAPTSGATGPTSPPAAEPAEQPQQQEEPKKGPKKKAKGKKDEPPTEEDSGGIGIPPGGEDGQGEE